MSLSNPFSHPSWLNVLFWILLLSFHIKHHTHQHSLLWSEYEISLIGSYAWTLDPQLVASGKHLESLAGGSRPLEVGFKFYIMDPLPGHSFCSLSQDVKDGQPASCACLHAFPAWRCLHPGWKALFPWNWVRTIPFPSWLNWKLEQALLNEVVRVTQLNTFKRRHLGQKQR